MSTRQKVLKYVFWGVFLIGFSGLALAEDVAVSTSTTAGETQYELEDVVITGTKTRLKIKDSPAAVSVVTKEEAEKKNVLYSDDLVTNLPGVQVARTQKGSQSTVVTLRGIPDYSRNLILLDGRSLQNPLNGRVFWNRVPVDLVERVEVVRGPFSSLYGKYAIGGVVNIITKEPQDRSFNFKNSYDSTNIRTTAVSYWDKPSDKLAFYLAFENQNVDGYTYYQTVQKTAANGTAAVKVDGFRETTDTQGNKQYIIGETAKPKLENNNYSGKVYYFPAEGHIISLLANYSYWDQPTDDGVLGKTYLRNTTTGQLVSNGTVELAGTGKTITVRDRDFLRSPGKNIFYVVGLDYKGKLSDIWDLSGSVEYTAGSNLLSVGTLAATATALSGSATGGGQGYQQEKKASLQTGVVLAQHHLILGTAVDYAPNRSTDAEHTFWRERDNFTEPYDKYKSKGIIYSGYLQDEWKIISSLTAFLGVRYDNWTRKDGSNYSLSLNKYLYYDKTNAAVVSPKASLVYRPSEEASIRASAGTAFNPPLHSQLYSYSLSATNETIANPDLVPEKDKAWEFGGEYTFTTTRTTVSGTYFANYLRDLIYSSVSFGSSGFTTTRYVNAGKTEIKGVETEIKQKIFTFLDASANYTYVNGKIIENSTAPESIGKLIPEIARHTANFGLDFKRDKFIVSLTGTYASKRYRTSDNSDIVNGVQGSYDPYAIAGIRFVYNLNNARLAVGVENITDKQYYTIYQTPGRTYNASLSYSFL